jgi:hypothetical protein
MIKSVIAISAILLSLNAGAEPVGETSTSMDSPELTKRVGLNIEPIWLVLGGLGAKFDFNLTKKFALSAQGIYIPPRWNRESGDSDSSYYRSDNYKWSYSEFNLGTTIMVIGDIDTHGMYINPAIGYVRAKITDYSTFNYQGELAAPQVRATVGYQWILGNFRLAAGGGFKWIGGDDIVVKDSAGREISREKSSSFGGLALDGQVGFVF